MGKILVNDVHFAKVVPRKDFAPYGILLVLYTVNFNYYYFTSFLPWALPLQYKCPARMRLYCQQLGPEVWQNASFYIWNRHKLIEEKDFAQCQIQTSDSEFNNQLHYR